MLGADFGEKVRSGQLPGAHLLAPAATDAKSCKLLDILPVQAGSNILTFSVFIMERLEQQALAFRGVLLTRIMLKNGAYPEAFPALSAASFHISTPFEG